MIQQSKSMQKKMRRNGLKQKNPEYFYDTVWRDFAS